MNGKKAIYGLFDKRTGRCMYVGRTYNPTAREKAHDLAKTTNGIPHSLKILKWVSTRHSALEEIKAILKFKKQGEAEFNINIGAPEPRKQSRGYCFKISSDVGDKFTGICDKEGLLYRKSVELAMEYYMDAGFPLQLHKRPVNATLVTEQNP